MCKKLVLLMIVLVICMSASAIAENVFVSEIKMQLITRGPKSGGRATIEVKNDSGQLVNSGTVSSEWSGAATNSVTSTIGSSGTARSDSIFSSGGIFTITITDVSVPGYTYNPSANAVTSTYISSDMTSYSYGGFNREYYLHVPIDKPTNGMPLVFVLHGWAQDEIFGTMNFTYMPALGDKYGFAVVYPQAYASGSSGTGAPGWTAGYPDDGPGDDVGFLSSLAQDLQNQYGFSANYTFTCGFSNGADMSYRLASEASDIFSGAGPVAGCMVTPIYENCNPSNPVSIIEIHGTSDNTTKYDGDPDWAGMGYYGAVDVTNLWAQLNGCTDTIVEMLYDGAVEATKHTGGSNGSEVWLYTWGGGHSWPSNNFEASEIIWDFFEQTVIGGGSVCGDQTCDPGEDQCNCPEDCGTPPSTETNCNDGVDEDCDTYTDCDDSDCTGDPACPTCGDDTCDPGEDQCNCPADCGTPPSTETVCDDGDDEDCDGFTDCDDSDCDTDPICINDCGNGVCDPGEDCNSCSTDCAGVQTGKPSGRYCCGNGTAEPAEGDGSICDGNY
jgi:polyhydroxybutyrate depolymerase